MPFGQKSVPQRPFGRIKLNFGLEKRPAGAFSDKIRRPSVRRVRPFSRRDCGGGLPPPHPPPPWGLPQSGHQLLGGVRLKGKAPSEGSFKEKNDCGAPCKVLFGLPHAILPAQIQIPRRVSLKEAWHGPPSGKAQTLRKVSFRNAWKAQRLRKVSFGSLAGSKPSEGVV